MTYSIATQTWCSQVLVFVHIMSASAITSPSPSCRPQAEAERSNRFTPYQGLSTLHSSKPPTCRHASQTTCPTCLRSSVLQVGYSSYDSCVTSDNYFICPAVTVSHQSTHLSSGELRVGPRRHRLIRDGDGKLCQEFQNVMCVLLPSPLAL